MVSRLTRLSALTLLALAATAPAQATEQELNIYSARHYQTDEALYANFTKLTGIKVNRLDGKEDELLERLKNEGAKSPADILMKDDIDALQRQAAGRLRVVHVVGETAGAPAPRSRRSARAKT